MARTSSSMVDSGRDSFTLAGHGALEAGAGADLGARREDRADDPGALADRAAAEQDRVADLGAGARPGSRGRARRAGRSRRPRRSRRRGRRARPARSARPASRPAPRGCPSSPAGSARGCRCPPSSRRAAAPCRPSPTSRGKTSRSIETFSPGGIRSSTERSSTYMPALISPGAGLAGLLEELEHLAAPVGADQAVGRGVLDRVQPERRPRAALLVGGEQSASGRGR